MKRKALYSICLHVVDISSINAVFFSLLELILLLINSDFANFLCILSNVADVVLIINFKTTVLCRDDSKNQP